MSTSVTQSGVVPFAVDNDAMAQARLKALPPSAQSKFEHLRRVELRQRALVDGLVEQHQHVREQRDQVIGDLGHFDRRNRRQLVEIKEDANTGQRSIVTAEPAERAALADRVQALNNEMKRIVEQQASANPGFSTAAILDFLVRQSSTRAFTSARVTFPTLGKSETFAQALMKNRLDQASLVEEIRFVENADTTVVTAKAMMRAQVQALADRGCPDVGPLFKGRNISWPNATFTATVRGGDHRHAVSETIKDAFALAIWANQDAIIAKLDRQIEAAGNDAIALDPDAKAQRLADLEGRLLRLQRTEEAIIERLEGDGLTIQRSCTDPLVLLGIE